MPFVLSSECSKDTALEVMSVYLIKSLVDGGEMENMAAECSGEFGG